MLLHQMLFQKRHILKELSTKVKGTPGPIVIVHSGMILNPLGLALGFQHFHLCRNHIRLWIHNNTNSLPPCVTMTSVSSNALAILSSSLMTNKSLASSTTIISVWSPPFWIVSSLLSFGSAAAALPWSKSP
mmetsp:Transcript_19843/g.36035  ORF Transcript_19843/g.36035 Transcript_19843/m.36035 type:complete len:131 (+) Transcript_19843:410-802(+)